MNWDQIKGNWRQFRGKAQQQWGKLTNDDLDVVEGKREELVGRIQTRYGIVREDAERQVKDWEAGTLARASVFSLRVVGWRPAGARRPAVQMRSRRG